MLAIAGAPDRRARSPRSTSARASRWRYGRDLRAAIFHRVGEFSAREVGKFGAPSLITRTTNDVQQVQMLVLMARDDARDGADHVRRRHRDGAARGRRRCRGCCSSCVPVLGRQHRLHHQPDDPAVPRDAAEDRRGQPRAARADHRHARGPRVRARAGRGRALRRRERRAHRRRRCASAGCRR